MLRKPVYSLMIALVLVVNSSQAYGRPREESGREAFSSITRVEANVAITEVSWSYRNGSENQVIEFWDGATNLYSLELTRSVSSGEITNLDSSQTKVINSWGTEEGKTSLDATFTRLQAERDVTAPVLSNYLTTDRALGFGELGVLDVPREGYDAITVMETVDGVIVFLWDAGQIAGMRYAINFVGTGLSVATASDRCAAIGALCAGLLAAMYAQCANGCDDAQCQRACELAAGMGLGLCFMAVGFCNAFER